MNMTDFKNGSQCSEVDLACQSIWRSNGLFFLFGVQAVQTGTHVYNKLPQLTVLFTCIGRRVSLLKGFHRAGKQVKADVRFFGTDTVAMSPALQLCDRAFLVKPTTHPGYINELVSLVRKHQVDLIVPTVDLDLKQLARHRARFAKQRCHVLVSSPEVIDICQDKRKTFRFLKKHAFDTPATLSARVASTPAKRKCLGPYPFYLKPWDGYAGRSNVLVHNRQELLFYARQIPRAICQEYVEGTEYTCDVYVDRDMTVRCVVPRKRMEIRAGEVSKAQIDKDPVIIEKTAHLVETLGAGPGVVTVQLIKTRQGSHKFIEINPRFGGGAPLSIKAGANFPKWVLQELIGNTPKIGMQAYTDQLTMLRYDAEVWVHEPSAGEVCVV
jgi:carbamoyl-phosphate synthase large subunit